jgi:soluble lytic murein transglycosylase-like protein
VKGGDSLIAISQRAKVPLAAVLKLNKLHMSSVIHPGQIIHLPGPPPGTPHNSFAGRTYPAAVVAAADHNRSVLAKRKLPTRSQARAMVVATAKAHGVDPALALAVSYQESGFDQHQVSPANAVGVMQVIPSSGRWASTLAGRPLNLLSTKDNITAGVVLLHSLLSSARSESEAIAGYYQGLSSVRSDGMFSDTRRYVANVQTLKARFAAGG